MTTIESTNWVGNYQVKATGDSYILRMQTEDWSNDVPMSKEELTNWFLRVVNNTYGTD